jgi:hypothetical protein
MKCVLYFIVNGHVFVTCTLSSFVAGSDSSTSPKTRPPVAAVALGGLTKRVGAIPWPFRHTRSWLLVDLHVTIHAMQSQKHPRYYP